jgi:hypothetical protein
VGTGGTGAFASGPVSGFGSIIVSDVHFDESLARIEDDEGMGRDRADLHLGTGVEVESDAIRNDAAVASRVRIVSERIGRVDAVAANLLTVNGLPVRVNGGTVFDDAFPGGIAGVALGTTVEVHGFATGTAGEVLATRVEPRVNPATFKFRANISALDQMARTFRIGSETFVYPLQVNGRNELADGAFLRVWVDPLRDGQGRWMVSSITRGAPSPADNLEVKTVGLITVLVSNANLQVGPWLVNASGAAIQNGPLAAGQRVKVEGRMQAGVLVASAVRVLGPPGGDELQMRGVIASVDPGSQTFLLNGRRERVSYAGSTFENGTAALLSGGLRVTAHGRLTADGTQLQATRIRIEN